MMTKRLICLCEWLLGHTYVLILLTLAGCAAAILLPGSAGIAVMAALIALPVLAAVYAGIPIPQTPGWRVNPPLASPWIGLQHILMAPDFASRHCLRVRHALLPFEPEPSLRLRAHSAALLLSTAAALACNEAEPHQRDGILAAVAPLGFTPERLSRRSPVLGQARIGSISGVLTRDGLGRRAYFMADPVLLSQECSLIYDGSERPITPEDRERILHAAEALREEGETPLAFAMAADGPQPLQGVFLGILSLGDALSPEAVADIHTLTPQGFHFTCPPLIGNDLSADLLCNTVETLYVAARPDDHDDRAVCELLPEDESPRSCAEAITRWADYARRVRRLLCLTAGYLAALLPAAVLLGVPCLALNMVLFFVIEGAWEAQQADAPALSPRLPSAFRLAAYCLIPFVVCLLVSVFLSAVGFAAHHACVPALMVFALFLRQRIILRCRAWRSPRSYATLLTAVLLSILLIVLLRPSAVAAIFAALSAAGGALIMRCLLPLRQRS